MSGPQRIQRRRTRGWRMPEGAVYVGRPTIYGNPFLVGGVHWTRALGVWARHEIPDRAEATRLFRQWAEQDTVRPDDYAREHVYLRHAITSGDLRGRDLVCWCPLDQPCHADVLLEIANTGRPVPR